MENAIHQTIPALRVPFDGTPEALEQDARAIAELLEHPGYVALQKAINGQRAIKDNTLSTNTLNSASANPADYAAVIGYRQGLADVDRIARGVIESAEVVAQVDGATKGQD